VTALHDSTLGLIALIAKPISKCYQRCPDQEDIIHAINQEQARTTISKFLNIRSPNHFLGLGALAVLIGDLGAIWGCLVIWW
jgi:hypothetical protein